MDDSQEGIFSCQICFNHYLPYDGEASYGQDRRPFIVCANGHSLCHTCKERITEDEEPLCPYCKQMILPSPIINRDLLKAVELLSKRLSETPDIIVEELELEPKPFSNGAFADVYKANWNTQVVAVKVIRNMHEIQKQQQLLTLEANLAIGLFHPNIIRLFGKTTIRDGGFSIVMEYADMGSLEKYRKELDQRVAVNIALGVVDGLSYVHSKRVAHRDIKPPNILLFGQEMTPKIADFGVAKFIQTIITNSAMVGTPKYCPPELLQPKSRYGFSVDIFSLSVMLFEMFSGLDAEKDLGDNVMQIMFAICQGSRPKFPPSFPGPLKDLVSRGWSQKPEERPPLSEFRSVLQNMTDRRTISDASVNKVNTSLAVQTSNVAKNSFAMPIMKMRWNSDCELLNSKEARSQMVEDLKNKSNMSGCINSAVLCTMETAPRHLFAYAARIPGGTGKDVVDVAYSYNRAMGATSVSNESAPEIIGVQLSMTEILPGHSVLTVGIKGGYIQSLIGQLVGINGRVVTVTANNEALQLCKERVANNCPFHSVITWIQVDNANDPEQVSKILQEKGLLFHTIIYCGEVSAFPDKMSTLLYPTGDVSIMAPVNQGNGDGLRFQLLTRRKNGSQMKTITDFSLRFETVK